MFQIQLFGLSICFPARRINFVAEMVRIGRWTPYILDWTTFFGNMRTCGNYASLEICLKKTAVFRSVSGFDCNLVRMERMLG